MAKKVGYQQAIYNASGITLTDGDETDLFVDSSGALLVSSSGSGTQNVQGTVADGATNSGNPVLIGGIYQSSLPTYTDGQRANLHTNVNGRLLVSTQALSSTTDSIVAVGNANSGATDSGAPVKVGGVYNSSAPTFTNGQRGDLQLDASGNLLVKAASAGTVGATVPTTAMYTGMRDNSGNLAVLKTSIAAGDSASGNDVLAVESFVFNGTNHDRAREVANAQNSTGTGIQAMGMIGQLDDTSTSSVTENQFAPVRITSAREMLTQRRPTTDTNAQTTNSTSTAYEASRVVKAAAGTVYGLTGYNSKATAQFVQLFNSTTVPADTAVPVVVFTVAGSSNFSLDFGQFGRYFSTGIAIANSSTGPTKTVGSADCWFDVQYI